MSRSEGLCEFNKLQMPMRNSKACGVFLVSRGDTKLTHHDLLTGHWSSKKDNQNPHDFYFGTIFKKFLFIITGEMCHNTLCIASQFGQSAHDPHYALLNVSIMGT